MAAGRVIATFVVLWLAWIALTGSLNPQELGIGALAAAVVAALSHELLFSRPIREKLQPRRLVYLLAYLPAYLWAELKAHAGVIYRILHPRMPIRPGIVEVPTELRTDLGITGLANAITMTPGTLSVEVDEAKPCLYVHWINVKALEPSQTRELVAKPFERFLSKVFG